MSSTTTSDSARRAGSPASGQVGQTRAEYRPDIDGIRGAAAIMVMGFHAHVPGFEGAYIGLDLFFVVSGYVITGLLMHEFDRTGGIKWGAFYARRARRLIPAKATMLLGVLIISYFAMTPTGQQQETAKSAAAAAVFVSNFFFWQHSDIQYFAHQPGTGPLLHTWSLSVEEQFYLALPLAILLAALLAKLLRVNVSRTLLFTTIALAVASLWVAMTLAEPSPQAAYYLPMSRAFEFLIGVGLALVARRIVLAPDLREVMGLAGAAIIAYVLLRPMPVDGYPDFWALLPCAGAFLMVWAGVGGATTITRFLSLRFLVGLGLVSYGWYLWHWPFLVFGESVNLATPPLWARVCLVLLALGVAYLSYRFVEGLFYKRSGVAAARITWAPRRVVITGVLAMATVAALAGGAVAVANHRAETPHWEAVSRQLDDVPKLPEACLEGGMAIPDRPGPCYINDFVEGRPTLVLWGDSHAWMFIPAIMQAAEGRDINLVAFVMGRCPPADPRGSDIRGACTQSNNQARSFVLDLHRKHQRVRVLIGASWSTYRGSSDQVVLAQQNDTANNSDYAEKMRRLFEHGTGPLFAVLGHRIHVPVDVIAPTAFLPRNAPLCEAVSLLFSCDVDRAKGIPNEKSDVAWIQEQMRNLSPGSRYIDPTPYLCDADTCFATSDGVVNYFDDNHLSASTSKALAKYFAPTIKAIAPLATDPSRAD